MNNNSDDSVVINDIDKKGNAVTKEEVDNISHSSTLSDSIGEDEGNK